MLRRKNNPKLVLSSRSLSLVRRWQLQATRNRSRNRRLWLLASYIHPTWPTSGMTSSHPTRTPQTPTLSSIDTSTIRRIRVFHHLVKVRRLRRSRCLSNLAAKTWRWHLNSWLKLSMKTWLRARNPWLHTINNIRTLPSWHLRTYIFIRMPRGVGTSWNLRLLVAPSGGRSLGTIPYSPWSKLQHLIIVNKNQFNRLQASWRG